MVMRGAVIEKLFTSGAGWFEGCSSCCSSPTSPLDLKLVMPPRRVVLQNSSCDEVVLGRGIGLGIIVNMDKSRESTAILVRQSHHVNANIDDEDEEYTIVTRHHKPNNNNNSYTRKQLVYDNCGDHEKLIRSLFDISPTPARVVDDIKAADAHFLSTCHECNKQLHGKDIYMYRGEKAFCSIECRSMEIAKMEEEESMKKKMMKRNKHDCGSSTSYAPQQVPVSRSSGHDHGQMSRVEFDDDDIKRAVGGWGVAHGYIKAMSQLNKANAALEKATSTPNPTKSVVGSSRKTTGASRRKVVFDCSGSRKTMMRVLPCFSLCGGGFHLVD
ncbi:cyclin-dependent kinase 1 [Tanacetum coccineum]